MLNCPKRQADSDESGPVVNVGAGDTQGTEAQFWHDKCCALLVELQAAHDVSQAMMREYACSLHAQTHETSQWRDRCEDALEEVQKLEVERASALEDKMHAFRELDQARDLWRMQRESLTREVSKRREMVHRLKGELDTKGRETRHWRHKAERAVRELQDSQERARAALAVLVARQKENQRRWEEHICTVQKSSSQFAKEWSVAKASDSVRICSVQSTSKHEHIFCVQNKNDSSESDDNFDDTLEYFPSESQSNLEENSPAVENSPQERTTDFQTCSDSSDIKSDRHLKSQDRKIDNALQISEPRKNLDSENSVERKCETEKRLFDELEETIQSTSLADADSGPNKNETISPNNDSRSKIEKESNFCLLESQTHSLLVIASPVKNQLHGDRQEPEIQLQPANDEELVQTNPTVESSRAAEEPVSQQESLLDISIEQLGELLHLSRKSEVTQTDTQHLQSALLRVIEVAVLSPSNILSLNAEILLEALESVTADESLSGDAHALKAKLLRALAKESSSADARGNHQSDWGGISSSPDERRHHSDRDEIMSRLEHKTEAISCTPIPSIKSYEEYEKQDCEVQCDRLKYSKYRQKDCESQCEKFMTRDRDTQYEKTYSVQKLPRATQQVQVTVQTQRKTEDVTRQNGTSSVDSETQSEVLTEHDPVAEQNVKYADIAAQADLSPALQGRCLALQSALNRERQAVAIMAASLNKRSAPPICVKRLLRRRGSWPPLSWRQLRARMQDRIWRKHALKLATPVELSPPSVGKTLPLIARGFARIPNLILSLNNAKKTIKLVCYELRARDIEREEANKYILQLKQRLKQMINSNKVAAKEHTTRLRSSVDHQDTIKKAKVNYEKPELDRGDGDDTPKSNTSSTKYANIIEKQQELDDDQPSLDIPVDEIISDNPGNKHTRVTSTSMDLLEAKVQKAVQSTIVSLRNRNIQVPASTIVLLHAVPRLTHQLLAERKRARSEKSSAPPRPNSPNNERKVTWRYCCSLLREQVAENQRRLNKVRLEQHRLLGTIREKHSQTVARLVQQQALALCREREQVRDELRKEIRTQLRRDMQAVLAKSITALEQIHQSQFKAGQRAPGCENFAEGEKSVLQEQLEKNALPESQLEQTDLLALAASLGLLSLKEQSELKTVECNYLNEERANNTNS